MWTVHSKIVACFIIDTDHVDFPEVYSVPDQMKILFNQTVTT